MSQTNENLNKLLLSGVLSMDEARQILFAPEQVDDPGWYYASGSRFYVSQEPFPPMHSVSHQYSNTDFLVNSSNIQHCNYCHSDTTNDTRGNCYACGAPRR